MTTNWRPISEKPTPSNDFEQDGYKQTGGLLLWIQWSPTSGQHAMGQWTQFKDGVSHWGVSWISSQEPLPVTHWCEITPPAEPVPQGYAEITIGGVKTLAKMDTASSLVVEHHVSGGTLMMVADDLAALRRDAERCDELHEAMLKLVDLIDARHDLHAVFTIKDSIECAYARSLIGKQTTLEISEGPISIIPYTQEAAQLMIDETVRKLRRVGYVIVADGAALRAVRAMTDQPQDAAVDALPDPAT